MDALHLTIEGMTCEHCVRAVDGRLRRTPGVQVERVSIGAADLHFDPAKLSVDPPMSYSNRVMTAIALLVAASSACASMNQKEKGAVIGGAAGAAAGAA